MKKTRNFGHEISRRRNLLICTNCLRTSVVLQLPQHQWNASSAQVDYPCSHTRVGIKLLSELVMMKTKVTLNLSLCFTDSNDSDSLQWWCTIMYYSVWWKLMSFITCFHISSRQKSLKFEIWSLTSDLSPGSLSTMGQSFNDTTQRWAVCTQ